MPSRAPGRPATPSAVTPRGPTIRRRLLLAFLVVGVTPAVVLAWLGFNRAGAALQAEIEHGLVAQAEAVASDIDKLMYERLQNAATWSRLEVVQDIQVGDVDKRLSGFLLRLQQGYGGLYRRLSATNAAGLTVASSDAALIGQPAAAAPAWQRVTLGGQRFMLEGPLETAPGGPWDMVIRAPVASAFGAGALGELRLVVNWDQVDGLLEQAADNGRLLALVDGQGRVVAGSKRLRAALPRFSPALAPWLGATPGVATTAPGAGIEGTPMATEAMIVGAGQARGFAGFDGLGWRVLVLVPRSLAQAPVRNMAAIFAAMLGAIALLTVLAAGWVSQAIARPIAALTEFTRQWMRDRHAAPPPAVADGEVGQLRDAFVQMVSDIDQSQQKLARASALAAVGEMSAAIAHEVRTPLGILRSSAQILKREAGLSAEARELIGFIESETQRLNGLVSSMLDSARARPLQFARADLHELIRHALGLLAAQAAEKQVQFSLHADAADARLDCDAEQMTQVLLNLLLNGLQILKAGGRIAITTRAQADQLCIEVADDGPGIAPEARARIFEAFFFQRSGGLGLGLAVVQRIIVAHGGDIEAAQSELGGALFRIRLPRHNPGLQ